ncbi:MAG: xanthine dehydrogenase FAD-binding subunit XdhB [Defluviitaleaceae bacterium]|nr:xanthine dehydrogenase FAD-binding subunit XdhB [Defluviitaleaceae bacterium]
MYDFNSYTEAHSIDEAVRALGGNPNARVIAGGTDVLIKLRSRDEAFVGRDLEGITRIPGLAGVSVDTQGDITIGAATSFSQIENDETITRCLASLGTAAGSIGGPQIRNVGTIGGNLANGATSADTAAVLLTYNASLVIHDSSGSHEMPACEFHTGPGKVRLEQGQLLTAVKIARADYEGYRGSYIKFAVRQAMDIATLGCAVLVKMDGNVIEDLRIAFGVAGPTPLRAAAAERFAKGKVPSGKILEQLGRICLEDTKARDSWRAAKAFREQLITVLPQRAISQALGGDGNA